MPNVTSQMAEAENACQHPMYENVSPYATKISSTIPNSQNPPRPLIEAVIETSNTQKAAITESAHDINVRTR